MDTNTIVRLNAEGAMAGCKPASPTRATVALWKGFVLALIAVCLAGCEDLKPITQSNPTSNANGSTDEMHELLMQMRPPEPKPAPPAPQPAPPAQRLAEPKAPPAVAGKGAEKLVAPASPVVVRPTTSEKTEVQASPAAPAAAPASPRPSAPPDTKPPTREEAGIVTTATATELIVKGPPRKFRARRAGGFVWVGLGLLAVAGGIGGRLYYVKRNPKKPWITKVHKDDELTLPPELVMRESENPPIPPPPVLAEES